MKTFLGETVVDVKDTKFKDFTQADWAMYFIERYGQIDGEHHKTWVLDQVSRILKGTPVIIKQAKWDNGLSEYRISTDVPHIDFTNWVEEMKGNLVDGGYEYDYDNGIAP